MLLPGPQESCYWYETIRLLTEPDGRDAYTILHEFGHFVMSRLYPGAWGTNSWGRGDHFGMFACPGFHHDPEGYIQQRCAWSEGWATFLSLALQDQAPDPLRLQDRGIEAARLGARSHAYTTARRNQRD
ncbi:hypothetical protein [Thermoflexus hugenholtzii]